MVFGFSELVGGTLNWAEWVVDRIVVEAVELVAVEGIGALVEHVPSQYVVPLAPLVQSQLSAVEPKLL